MKQLAMFGGSFNPIHNGHIQLAETARVAAGLDKVILIPTFIPPHKSNKHMAESFHRLEMCRLACEGFNGLTVSDIEIKRKGPSYTIDTLKALKLLYPDSALHLILGADMFITLMEWKNPLLIFQTAKLITAPRNKTHYKELFDFAKKIQKSGAEFKILEDFYIPLSSTKIRKMISTNNKNVCNYINPKVYSYIIENGLF